MSHRAVTPRESSRRCGRGFCPQCQLIIRLCHLKASQNILPQESYVADAVDYGNRHIVEAQTAYAYALPRYRFARCLATRRAKRSGKTFWKIYRSGDLLVDRNG